MTHSAYLWILSFQAQTPVVRLTESATIPRGPRQTGLIETFAFQFGVIGTVAQSSLHTAVLLTALTPGTNPFFPTCPQLQPPPSCPRCNSQQDYHQIVQSKHLFLMFDWCKPHTHQPLLESEVVLVNMMAAACGKMCFPCSITMLYTQMSGLFFSNQPLRFCLVSYLKSSLQWQDCGLKTTGLGKKRCCFLMPHLCQLCSQKQTLKKKWAPLGTVIIGIPIEHVALDNMGPLCVMEHKN